MTYTESTGHMAIFQYGFFSCRGVHSSPWLTIAPWLSGELSRPDISLARVELVLQGTLGNECWWHSSMGCSWGASQWFLSLQGWGGDTSTRLTVGSLWAPQLSRGGRRQLSVRLPFSLSVLETSALGRWHPSPLNHHTHPGGGGRGQHAEGSLWSPALTAALRTFTPLVETRSAQPPWRQSP